MEWKAKWQFLSPLPSRGRAQRASSTSPSHAAHMQMYAGMLSAFKGRPSLQAHKDEVLCEISSLHLWFCQEATMALGNLGRQSLQSISLSVDAHQTYFQRQLNEEAFPEVVRGTGIWVIRWWVLWQQGDKRGLSVAMASGSSSAPMVEERIKALEKELRRLKAQQREQKHEMIQLDEEAGRRFELVDEDLIWLWEEVTDTVDQKLKEQTNSHEDLEFRVLKVEMQVAKLTFEWQTEKEADRGAGVKAVPKNFNS